MPADLVRLLRPSQWVKNVFVLAPLVFSGASTDLDAVLRAGLAFALFCAAASLGYVANDLLDVAADRAHPVKRHRPLAAGTVSTGAARLLVVLLALVLLAGVAAAPEVGMVAIAYLGVSVAYSVWLKHLPVLDLFTIASGFVLRVHAGAVAIDVPVSHWMFVTTLCLALFLAVVKRQAELRAVGGESRRVLAAYTPQLLDRYATTAALGAVTFYSLFVITSRPALVLTVPIVLLGLFRYWLITERDASGEDPTSLVLRDRMLGATVIAWVLAVVLALYGR